MLGKMSAKKKNLTYRNVIALLLSYYCLYSLRAFCTIRYQSRQDRTVLPCVFATHEWSVDVFLSRIKRYQSHLGSLEANPETSRLYIRICSKNTYLMPSPARSDKIPGHLFPFPVSLCVPVRSFSWRVVVILCQFLDFGEKLLQTIKYHFYATVTRFLLASVLAVWFIRPSRAIHSYSWLENYSKP